MAEAKHINSKGEHFRHCVSEWARGGRDFEREDILDSGSQMA